jgi:hypothetical protein
MRLTEFRVSQQHTDEMSWLKTSAKPRDRAKLS